MVGWQGFGQLDAGGRGAGEASVQDGGAQDSGEHAVDVGDGAWVQAGVGEVFDPGLDERAGEICEGEVSEGGEGVVAQVAHVLIDRCGPQDAGGEPAGGVVGERDLRAGRVEVGAGNLVRLNASGECGGLPFGGEAVLAGSAGAAAGFAVAHDPRVVATRFVGTRAGLEDAGHGAPIAVRPGPAVPGRGWGPKARAAGWNVCPARIRRPGDGTAACARCATRVCPVVRGCRKPIWG